MKDLTNRTLGPRQHQDAHSSADHIKYWAIELAKLLEDPYGPHLTPEQLKDAHAKARVIAKVATKLEALLSRPSKVVEV